MKKFIKITVLTFLVIVISGCGNKITIPNIYNTDETTAKNVLSSNGIIPTIQYEYNDEIEEGYVIYTEPSVGSSVEKNSQVLIVVSKGPSIVYATDARISWYNIGYGDDKWEFYTPYIENNILKIKCFNVKFASSIEWNDQYNEGKIIGNASINDTFDKTVPVSAVYQKKSFNANEAQNFTIEIPLKDLNVSKPTNMYIELFAYVQGKSQNINVSFTMTW